MSFDFSSLQAITIPEGAVSQIMDAAGNVLWETAESSPMVLEVEKITAQTYAGETSYGAESFVLLDIYPKDSNSTVDVTYGGLTKTLTFDGTNAKPVYFGTFNGVADDVETPASGTLTIEGGYSNVAAGTYSMNNKGSGARAGCITKVTSWGNVRREIPDYAFDGCRSLVLTSLPAGVKSIGSYAFQDCTNLALDALPAGVTSLGFMAFAYCENLALVSLPSGLTALDGRMFDHCTKLALTSLPDGMTDVGDNAFSSCENILLTSLPTAITRIGDNTFAYCKKIRITEFPEGLLSIGAAAFRMGSDLSGVAMYGATITLPSTLQSISSHAFSVLATSSDAEGAGYLAGVKILATTPPAAVAGGNMFGLGGDFHGKTFTITVPAGCGAAYKAAVGWIDYADCIVEES